MPGLPTAIGHLVAQDHKFQHPITMHQPVDNCGRLSIGGLTLCAAPASGARRAILPVTCLARRQQVLGADFGDLIFQVPSYRQRGLT